jgi:hypothetical protein
MDEIIPFVPKSERERGRLIRGARVIYDSISRRLIPSARSGTRHQLVIRLAPPMPIVATGFSCRDRDHRCALQPLLSGKLPPGNRHHLGLR